MRKHAHSIICWTFMVGSLVVTNLMAAFQTPLHPLKSGEVVEKRSDWVPQLIWETTGEVEYWQVLHFGSHGAITLDWEEQEVWYWYVEDHAPPLRYFLRVTSADRDEWMEVSVKDFENAVIGEQWHAN